MTTFLDLLEAYHHWCVRGDRSRLEGCEAWLTTLTTVPGDEMEWHRLGTGGLDWLVPFPPDWDATWRVLSPRQMSLTVEALEYLEAHRPGAIAAALGDSPSTPIQAPQAPIEPPAVLSNVSVHWSLTDVINCVNREVQKREASYPQLVQRGRLSAERARQELGQMKAALEILMEMRDQGQDVRQRTLFD